MYDQYAIHFHNTIDHRWQIKQEYVAKSGLWIAKKRYAQWVIFKEGKPTNKLDIKGLDVVRSSFPTEFKTIQCHLLEAFSCAVDKELKLVPACLLAEYNQTVHALPLMNNHFLFVD